MTPPPKSTWIPAAVAFAILAWMYGTDVADAIRARTSEVAALTALPNPFYAAGVLCFALAAVAAFVAAMAQRRPADYRGYRLLPILTVLVLFVDLFVLPNPSAALPAFTTSRAVELLAQQARAPDGRLITDAATLEGIAARMEAPHYLAGGVRVPSYAVKVHTDCAGPLLSAAGERAGTLLYCLSAAQDHAWITAVGLPDDQRFGDAAIFSVGGVPYVGQVSAGTTPSTPPIGAPPTSPSSSVGGG